MILITFKKLVHPRWTQYGSVLKIKQGLQRISLSYYKTSKIKRIPCYTQVPKYYTRVVTPGLYLRMENFKLGTNFEKWLWYWRLWCVSLAVWAPSPSFGLTCQIGLTWLNNQPMTNPGFVIGWELAEYRWFESAGAHYLGEDSNNSEANLNPKLIADDNYTDGYQ